MKKIIINIPDGADEKLLTVFSAQQQVAFKQPDGNWFVLEDPCIKCAKCCMDDLNPFSDESPCPHLNSDNECSLVYIGARPFRCGCDNPTGIPEYCSIKYGEIK